METPDETPGPSAADEVPRRRRRWLRFSLRTLLVLMLLAALCMAWLGARGRRLTAIRQLEDAGIELQIRQPPKWVKQRLGDYVANGMVRVVGLRAEYFGFSLGDDARPPTPLAEISQLKELKRLQLDFCYDVDDQSIRRLQGLRRLEELSLNGTNVGDKAMEVVGRMHRLQVLRLNDTYVTDRGCALLERLTKLQRLELRGTGVTGVGIESIGRLSSLTDVDLATTAIGDNDLAPLAKLELTTLNLSGTGVTSQGIASLGPLEQAEQIILVDTAVDDAAAALLARLPRLRSLNLSLTKVTDAGLAQLADAPALCELHVFGAPVTDKGVAALRNQSPIMVYR